MPSPTVLILQADVFATESLRVYVAEVYPGVRCLLAKTVEGAAMVLASGPIDLFIAASDIADADVLDLLLLCRHRGCVVRQILVTLKHPAPRVLVSLRALAVDGVFDVEAEAPEQMRHVLRLLEAGRGYWSPGLWKRINQHDLRLVSHQLAPSEQLGLAIIGDGCGDEVASTRLNMTQSSMRALRRDLHVKLGVHHRHGMIRSAAQLGYTRFTSAGVVAFGLAIVVMEYLIRSKRPVTLPPELLAHCRIGADGIVPPIKARRERHPLFPLK